MIRIDTCVRVRGRSLYVSSMELHNAQLAAYGSGAEKDWQSTHEGQELEIMRLEFKLCSP